MPEDALNYTAASGKHGALLKLYDGRLLGYAEYGASSGDTIIYFHGLPGSRLEAQLWHESALLRNIRIIAPDRPGIGLSTRKPRRTVNDYPTDIAQLVAHLGLGQYTIIGVSGGGMYALACGAQKVLLPGLIEIAIVAGLGPRNISQSGMALHQKIAFKAMDWIPGILVGWLWDVMIGRAARNPDRLILENLIRKSFADTKGPDGDLLKDENIINGTTESIRGAFAQGSMGYVDEATLSAQLWGFELANVQGISVKLWYGAKDDIAPSVIGKALEERIPQASCFIFEGDGHMGTIMKHQDEVLEALVNRARFHESDN